MGLLKTVFIIFINLVNFLILLLYLHTVY